jgi:hypothetical protein
MLGLYDAGVILGYVFTIVFMLACVLYGILNWNKGGSQDGS